MAIPKIVGAMDRVASWADRALSFGREMPPTVPGPFVGGGVADFSNKWFRHDYEIRVKGPALNLDGAQALVAGTGAAVRPNTLKYTGAETVFEVSGMRGIDAGFLDNKGSTPDAINVHSIGWE